MKKLKIKKNVKKISLIIIVIALFLSIGLYSGIKIYKQKQYEKTYEYKLITLGYSESETKTLLDNYQEKEIEYILTNEVNNNYLNLLNDKYFIYEYFYTYLEELEKNPNNSIRNIIEKVNTLTNYEYYTNTVKADISKNELMLVNKYYYLDKDYIPENLVSIPTTYSWGEYGSKQVVDFVYEAYLNMWKSANSEANLYLMANSTYRDYDKQEDVYNEYKDARGEDYADSIAARPGFSEHQTGYTLDIFEKNATNQETFHESAAYAWLKDNAHRFGFILRYPSDKEDVTGYSFESWHFRYVGIDVATYIYENNITFDEYYAYFVK